MQIPYKHFKDNNSFIITDHALEQWNERVGPEARTKGELATHLACYFNDLGRIARYERGCIVLDDDIVAGCKLSPANEIIVQTFFGRISLNPILNNTTKLFRYIKKQTRSTGNLKTLGSARKEGINLSIPKDVLSRQHFPIPSKEKVIHTPVLFEISKNSEQSFLVKPLIPLLEQNEFVVNLETLKKDIKSMREHYGDLINEHYYSCVKSVLKQISNEPQSAHVYLEVRKPQAYSLYDSLPNMA